MLHDIVKKGSVDRSVRVKIIDSADGTPETGVVFNTSGIDLWYRRQLEAKTSITEATLAALTTAHADGGFLHIGDGIYRLDLPDAAFATGAQYVEFGGTVTGMIVIGGVVRLVDIDVEDVIRAGLTGLPAATIASTGGQARGMGPYLRKYATLLVTGTTAIQLPLEKTGGGLAGSGDFTHAAGDTQVSIDGGALANTTNAPTYNDGWELILTGAELTGKNIRVFIKDQTTKVIADLMVTIETFGHASAMFISDIAADVIGTPAGASLAADIAAVKSDTAGIAAKASQASVDDLPTSAELATALGTADDAVLTRLGTPAGASLAADLAAIFAAVDDIGVAGAGLTNQPNKTFKKNTARAAFMFIMRDETTGLPTTGLTVTAERSIDGAAFGACANAVAEISAGAYKISLAAGDLNADTVMLKFTATGAKALFVSIVTQN